jgi:hypothetical protein
LRSRMISPSSTQHVVHVLLNGFRRQIFFPPHPRTRPGLQLSAITLKAGKTIRGRRGSR